MELQVGKKYWFRWVGNSEAYCRTLVGLADGKALFKGDYANKALVVSVSDVYCEAQPARSWFRWRR